MWDALFKIFEWMGYILCVLYVCCLIFAVITYLFIFIF